MNGLLHCCAKTLLIRAVGISFERKAEAQVVQTIERATKRVECLEPIVVLRNQTLYPFSDRRLGKQLQIHAAVTKILAVLREVGFRRITISMLQDARKT